MTPALTQEEWEAWGITGCRCEVCIGQMSPHAQAALALHGLVVDGEPVGFTRAMVDILADALEGAINDGWGHNDERALAAQAIENIRALLPPEAK